MPDPTGTEVPAANESPAGEDAAERLPADIDAAILRRYFTSSAADFGQIGQCRGASNKLGFGVQLCSLRWRGHFLADTRDVPAAVLQVLATQIGVLRMPLGEYPQDDNTRSAHLERIRHYLEFERSDPVKQPIPLVGGPLHGQECQLDAAPEVYGAPVGNSERVAYYRLDLNANTYIFIGER